MTSPREQDGSNRAQRTAKIGDISVQMIDPDASMLVSIDLRYREAQRSDDPVAEFSALSRIFESVMSRLLVDPADKERVIDELADGRIDAKELLGALMGFGDPEPANRAERRAAERAPGVTVERSAPRRRRPRRNR